MLAGLFEGEDNSNGVTEFPSITDRSGQLPLPPRLASRLCGIYNQGATCYMNSLLQTLLMTPEFRESLFLLKDRELGRLEDKDKPNAKIRVIPIQLQRLFSRLLLLEAQGCKTTELTDSFGWTNREEVIQHDAQELNRILFSAVEDSLIGTSGQTLIKNLYHGTIVNQIVCLECRRVSEREEDFMDICVSVTGVPSLEAGLQAAYVETESLSGNNQYRCECCNKLVDAKKGAKLRNLPPILTFSLLRFSFDYVKLERYKETGKFTFPHSIDMAQCCENVSQAGDTEYELFSVVIHRGSTHGGHYHAYIRDIDNLGNWTHPDREEIQIATDPATGKVDFIEYDSPVELIQAILAKHGGSGMGVDRLCAELVKQTGVSWNKRFKKTNGPINKFLKKYDDKFVFNEVSNWLSLKTYGSVVESKATQDKSSDVTDTKDTSKHKRPLSPPPEITQQWFDFDDSRVRPIRTQEIEKQFSGKESGYMLFYRRKSLHRPQEALGNPVYGIPEHLVKEVEQENEKLRKEREEYELKVNTITLDVHFEQLYTFKDGAIQSLAGGGSHLELEIDRRKTIEDLILAVTELGGELMYDHFVISLAKMFPAGLHIHQCLSEDPSRSLQSHGLCHRDNIFVWDGRQIKGEEIQTGPEHDPVYLNITYGNPDQLSRGFPKSLTLAEIKLMLNEIAGLDFTHMQMSRLVTKGDETKSLPFIQEDDSKSLAELQLDNGDQVICEDRRDSQHTLVHKAVSEQNKKMSFVVELKTQEKPEGSLPTVVAELDKDSTVFELKAVVKSQANIDDLEKGGRLRVDDPNLGLKQPLHEEQSLTQANLRQGMKLVLEHGAAPTGNQITVIYTTKNTDTPYKEMTLERNTTVGQCLDLMIQGAELLDDNWHLRRTNFFQETTKVLDDLDLTLEQAEIHDGDTVILEEGKLPPKGFLKLSPFLLTAVIERTQTLTENLITGDRQDTKENPQGITSWLLDGVKGLLTGSSDDASNHSSCKIFKNVPLGDIIISKEATLEDLKTQIMTLPKMESISVPMSQFLRVRLIENGRPTVVLRGPQQSLQRLKVASSSQLLVQVLPQEENLTQNQILLNVLKRDTQNRTYTSSQEFTWDISRGATPQLYLCNPAQKLDTMEKTLPVFFELLILRQVLADFLIQPVEKTVIAKHFVEKYDWLVIQDTSQKSKKQSKGKGQKKVNLKQAPYYIKDGDDIGVKNLANDPFGKDDFHTIEDDLGIERLLKEAEEKKKRREESKRLNQQSDFGGAGDTSKSNRRPEVGIRIHVGDFSY